MNSVISSLIETAPKSLPVFAEWHKPTALAFYRYLRGMSIMRGKSAQEFVASQAGTMHAVTKQPLAVCERHVYATLLMWAENGLIAYNNSAVDNNIAFLEPFKSIANAPVRPMLDMPEDWDTGDGGNGIRALVSGRPVSMVSDDQIEALNTVQATAFTINHTVLAKLYDNSDCLSDSPMEQKALEWAVENLGKEYYLPVFLDWRGRIYTDSGAICSYQGGDIHRALCDFADADVLVEGSDELDHFLDSLEAEYNVTPENYERVIDLPVPPVYNSKARFFCRLRAALAIKEVIETGKTQYILQQDATCSGMGHMACIMRDRGLAEKTALLGSIGKDEDLYTITATTAVNTPRYFTYKENDCEFDISPLLEIPEVREEIGRRSQAKKTVMVTAYGSSVVGNADGWLQDSGFVSLQGKPLDRVLLAKSWDDCPTADDTGFVATIAAAKDAGYTPAQLFLCLANAYFRALDKHYPSIQRFVGHMRAMYQKSFNRDGVAPTWTSSIGMTCQKTKITIDTDTESRKSIMGQRVLTNGIDTFESAAGQAPNFVHSEDASLIGFTIIDAANDDNPFAVAPIHDSWGCPPSKSLRMRQIVRDRMVAMHSGNLLESLETFAGYKALARGDWDLSDMAASMIGC